MAATSRPQQPPNRRRSAGRLIVNSLRATVGRGRAAVERIRPIKRMQVPQQTGAPGKPALRRLRILRDRSVAGIRHLVGQGVRTTRHLPARASRQVNRLTRHGPNAGAGRTIPAGEPVDRDRSARSRGKASYTSVDRAAERGLAAVEPIAASERHQAEVKPVKGRGRTRRTRQRQEAKPRQAQRRQDLALEQQTVRELRKRAKEADIKGRSSMTKDQLIKALREYR
jgi:Rho termination factor, N-terminal domain